MKCCVMVMFCLFRFVFMSLLKVVCRVGSRMGEVLVVVVMLVVNWRFFIMYCVVLFGELFLFMSLLWWLLSRFDLVYLWESSDYSVLRLRLECLVSIVVLFSVRIVVEMMS